MTALQKIKSLFKRPKVKDKVEQPKATVAPEKKAGESSQHSTGSTWRRCAELQAEDLFFAAAVAAQSGY